MTVKLDAAQMLLFRAAQDTVANGLPSAFDTAVAIAWSLPFRWRGCWASSPSRRAMPLVLLATAFMPRIAWRMRQQQAPRRNPADRYVHIPDRLREAGRFGRKTGAGNCRYDDAGRKTRDPDVEALVTAASAEKGILRQQLPVAEIQVRALAAIVNEAALLVGEGVALRAPAGYRRIGSCLQGIRKNCGTGPAHGGSAPSGCGYWRERMTHQTSSLDMLWAPRNVAVVATYAMDDATTVIAAYIEGIRSVEKFCSAANAVRAAGKPLVVYKVGRSDSGARAAVSHTGAMTGFSPRGRPTHPLRPRPGWK